MDDNLDSSKMLMPLVQAKLQSAGESEILCQASGDKIVFRWMRQADVFKGYFPDKKQMSNETIINSFQRYNMIQNRPVFAPQNIQQFMEQFDEIILDKKTGKEFKLLQAMYLGMILMRSTLWIEKQSDNSGPWIGHICDLHINQKAGLIIKDVDVLPKFIKVIEDIAWYNGCTVILFPANLMEVDQFHKLGYHFASKSFQSTSYDLKDVHNCQDE